MKQSGTALTEKIASRLRVARKAQGLSLAKLSARTGSLSKSRISNYEQGLRRMGLEEAQKLAAALGTLSPVYLLCLDDEEGLSQDELTLLQLFRGTDGRGQEAILDIARVVTQFGENGEQTRDQGTRGGSPAPSSCEQKANVIARMSTRRPPEDTERLVQERFSYYSLDYGSYEKRSSPASWHCAKHGIDFTAVGASLIASSSIGCPACLTDRKRERRRQRLADPDLERHLAVLKALGNERDLIIYRRRVTGAKAAEIAAELRMKDVTVSARLQKIRRILAEADKAEQTQTRAVEN